MTKLPALSFAMLISAAAGCNAILGNDPGYLVGGRPPGTNPSGGQDATTSGGAFGSGGLATSGGAGGTGTGGSPSGGVPTGGAGIGGTSSGGRPSGGAPTGGAGIAGSSLGGSPTGGVPGGGSGGSLTDGGSNTGGADAGVSCPNADRNTIPMDATGWVARECNDWGIQGAWYWFSDATSGGQTVITSPAADTPPFAPGRGMCLQGTTVSGSLDNYLTWGAGIGLNLNEDPGNSATPVLPNAPPCYTITLSATSLLGGIRAKLLANPGLAGHEAPGQDLFVGPNKVCVSTVGKPSWCCPPNTTICDDNTTLAGGIAAVEVQIASGDGGPIDFCIESIVPSATDDGDAGTDAGAPRVPTPCSYLVQGSLRGSVFPVSDTVASSIAMARDVMCVNGVAAQVRANDAGQLDYSGIWGANVGWNLNQELGVSMPRNPADVSAFNAVRVGLAGATGLNLRLQLEVPDPDGGGMAYYCAPLPAAGGTISFLDLKTNCWGATGNVPFDKTTMRPLSVSIAIVTDADRAYPFDFCVTEFTFQS